MLRLSPIFDSLPLQEVSIKLAPSSYLPVGADVLRELMVELGRDWPVVDFIEHERAGFGRACLRLPLQYAFKVLGLRFKVPELGLRLIYQANLFRLDWERRESTLEYPGFTDLLSRIESSLHRVIRVLGEDYDCSFHACNLSYQNFLRMDAFPKGSDVSVYIHQDFLAQALEPDFVLHEHNICWKEPSGIDYRFHVRTVAEEDEAGKDLVGLQISTTAGMVFDTNSGFPVEETRELNSLLNRNFMRLISDRAKREWGLQDE